jgi:spermidine/putrescine transport system permease protein
MMNPDIVTGVSMMLLFVFVGRMLSMQTSLSFWTMLIAHITFSLPYVILSVMPKIKQMDKHLPEAAMDLGCTPLMSFFKVELPCILPGVISGMLMAFTLSLDDFVISYFVTGMDFVTLPVEIYSYTKKPIPPKIYALFTILFLLIFVLLVTMNLLQMRSEKKKNALYGKR